MVISVWELVKLSVLEDESSLPVLEIVVELVSLSVLMVSFFSARVVPVFSTVVSTKFELLEVLSGKILEFSMPELVNVVSVLVELCSVSMVVFRSVEYE